MLKRSLNLFLFSLLVLALSNLACIDKESPETQETTLPLINQMSFMQYFGTKLYFAGIGENWELADFYSHELEETAEDVVDANFEYHGYDISQLLEAMLYPAIESLEEAIDAKDLDLFKNNYQTLLNSCNACHAATGYPFLKMKTPEHNPYNQVFGKE